MLLYKTTYSIDTSVDGTSFKHVAEWGGSQTEAAKHRVGAKGIAHKKPETQTIEVPTNKAGLLEWLNANVTS